VQAIFHNVTHLEETSEIYSSNSGEYNTDFRNVTPRSLVEIYKHLEKCATIVGCMEKLC
jgi:hypothetical protein